MLRLSRYDATIDAYQKSLIVTPDAFQGAHLHVLCSEAENGAHRYQEALAQCDLAEWALGPASDAPEPQWLSSWFAVQDARMGVLYWLKDTGIRPTDRANPSVRRGARLRRAAQEFLSQHAWIVSAPGPVSCSRRDPRVRAGRLRASTGRPSSSGWTEFNFAFALLWHGDLDEATVMLQESLQKAGKCGDAALRSRSLTYLMAAGRKRGDVDGVRKAIGSVIERAREASLPEYEAMAIANRAWVAWRTGEEEKAATDALAALEIWEGLPVRYCLDWMALWPLLVLALASQRIEQAIEYARGMLPPPQQLLQEPVRTMVDSAVYAWDAGRATLGRFAGHEVSAS